MQPVVIAFIVFNCCIVYLLAHIFTVGWLSGLCGWLAGWPGGPARPAGWPGLAWPAGWCLMALSAQIGYIVP